MWRLCFFFLFADLLLWCVSCVWRVFRLYIVSLVCVLGDAEDARFFVVCCPLLSPGKASVCTLCTWNIWMDPTHPCLKTNKSWRQAPHQSPSSSLRVVDDENSCWCSFLIHRRDLCRRLPFILDSAFDPVLCEKNKVCNIITLSFFIRGTKETVQEKSLRTEAQAVTWRELLYRFCWMQQHQAGDFFSFWEGGGLLHGALRQFFTNRLGRIMKNVSALAWQRLVL